MSPVYGSDIDGRTAASKKPCVRACVPDDTIARPAAVHLID